MSEKSELKLCPICYEKIAESFNMSSGVLYKYKCQRCGEFYVDRILIELDKGAWYDVKHLASAWVRRKNKNGIVPTFGENFNGISDLSSPEWWAKQFSYLGLPETISEKMNALLVLFGEASNGYYDTEVSPHNGFVSEIGAKDFAEVLGLARLLSQAGYLNPLHNLGVFKITVKGWLHIEELKKKVNLSNSAFVAMWFDDTTKKYREAVITAVNYCGYKSVIIDQQEFNDFIMNQVVSSIKQSRFLIADFTSRPEFENDGKVKNGVRGGVYWEAGMAYGLGIPVIHTCEDNKDSYNRIHFDVNQYNTIFWKPEELDTNIRPIDKSYLNPNFAEKLTARILATIGKGNYVLQNSSGSLD